MSNVAFSMEPGKGLGAFRLGTPLAQVVAHLREKKSFFRCVELKYADQDMLHQDIILNFPEHGIHLRFEPKSQRLRLIEAYDLTRAQVYYHGKPVGGAQHPATFVRVYDICGRTYPGEYDQESKMYFLHYPGLLFMFPIPAQHAHLAAKEELPIEFPDGTTPVASRLVISAMTCVTPREIISAQAPPMAPGDTYYEVVEACLGVGLRFCTGGQHICFGDTAEDVSSELGCPTETLVKGMDTMAINAGAAKSRGIKPMADYFYHYAHRGLDILFCGRLNVVKKFVLRTNVPGHPEFSVYQKCNFCLLPSNGLTSTRKGFNTTATVATPRSAAQVNMAQESRPAQHGVVHAEITHTRGQMADLDNDLLADDVFLSDWERPGNLLEGITEWQFQPAAREHGTPSVPQPSAPSSATAVSEGQESGDSLAAALGQTPPSHTPSEPAERDARDGWDDWDGVENLLQHPADTASEASTKHESVPHHAGIPTGLQRPMEFQGAPPLSTRMPENAEMMEHHGEGTLIFLDKGQGGPETFLGRKLLPQTESKQLGNRMDASGLAGITADSTWEAVKQVMGGAGRATIQSRQRMQTHIYGFRGVAFEVMRNGHLASMTLFQP